jgi:hypothetical protein
MAQSGHADCADECPLSGVKRTRFQRSRIAILCPLLEVKRTSSGRAVMSANDPKRTFQSCRRMSAMGKSGHCRRTESLLCLLLNLRCLAFRRTKLAYRIIQKSNIDTFDIGVRLFVGALAPTGPIMAVLIEGTSVVIRLEKRSTVSSPAVGKHLS